MSSAALPTIGDLPSLLLVEPQKTHSVRADQLAGASFRITRADCAREIVAMRHTLRLAVAVLSDEIGATSLCAAAESVRWQWPLARILILGRVPAAMKDQLYDETAAQSVDRGTLLSTIDRLAEDPWHRNKEQFFANLQGENSLSPASRTGELRESDPTKTALIAEEVRAHDLPSDRYRPHRRGHYAFPPSF